MKKSIHPEYFESQVTCSGCGHAFKTGSTLTEIRVNICSKCHPFYTGKQKMIDTEGRVDRFKRKYGGMYSSAKKTTDDSQASS